MQINKTKWLSMALVLAGATLAGCGGDKKADAPASDMADKAAEVAADATDAAAGAADAAGEMMDDAKDAAGDMADAAEGAMSDAKDAAGEMMDDAKDAAEGAMADAKDGMEGMMHDAKDAADGAMADAKEAMTGGAAAADDGDPCTLNIQAGDNIAYSTNALSVPASCGEVSVTLTHTGNLPKEAMGHNWVLLPESAVEEVAMAGMGAGAGNNYIPEGEARVVANTAIVGGGESSTATFNLSDLEEGVSYVYVCTFPGHWSIMKGTFSIS
ncbi:MAG: azurin [Pseudomonadota bacterium]